ncbi:hypothetical protein SNE25_29570 [Mucilaginibacter sabulilitoris]|uniref:Uncharacterized protein n=1 Tax=Mucilaginibacter sabulilitoris TaxID=1173583 RepID=A0ABZ0TP17_9SPHI|nr:hypothetical protein [Mucilaginibacter sabulilitoris]WPU93469.1 hypothetical protein SNE25_29570 [Mucilaginibacter sabulilitoris]
MKILTLFLFTLAALAAGAQIKSSSLNRIKPPLYFLDSVKVSNEYITYLNPDEISDVHVDKNEKYPNGALFISLKDHSIVGKLLKDKLLSLNDIRSANTAKADRHKAVIYIIDDKLLTDTANVRIPAMFVKNVSVVKAAETPYFKTALPNVLLMRISTKPPQLRIRGEAASR